MKKQIRTWTALGLFGFLLAGCGTTAQQIQIKSQSVRTDVFAEVSADEPIPQGWVELTIKARLKTHVEGHYFLESEDSFHGKDELPFLFNIDGQSVIWKSIGVREGLPVGDSKEKLEGDPEAQEGVKYALERKISLAAGKHRIFFALPGNNYWLETEFKLKNGKLAVLELKPKYRKGARARYASFLNGIKKYEVFLNGERVR